MSAEHFQGHNKGHSLVKWNDGVVSRMELRGDEIKDFWGDLHLAEDLTSWIVSGRRR